MHNLHYYINNKLKKMSFLNDNETFINFQQKLNESQLKYKFIFF